MSASTSTRPIVVGIDGSPSSDLALDWAARQAAAEGLPLVLLTAVTGVSRREEVWLFAHGIESVQLRAQLEDEARALLRRCDARIEAAHPGLVVQHEVVFADPRETLLGADAALLVLGTRGLGSVHRLLVGSVTSAVAKHATTPVVVVRPERVPAGRSGVVVAVAGDEDDAATVDLAFRLASTRGLPVTAFHSLWDLVGVDDARDVPADEPGYPAERKLLAQAVAAAQARHPEVEVRHQLSRGFADRRLVSASRTADLMVVGHRRKAFYDELVHGSTAPAVVEHAACTVVVVPHLDQGVQAD